MNENLFQIILSAIPVIGALITCLIIPYIKANVDAAKLAQYREWASLAVKAAEMLWQEAGRGKDKKAYVVRFLNSLFNAQRTVITEEQLDVLIEAAVKEMKELERREAI